MKETNSSSFIRHFLLFKNISRDGQKRGQKSFISKEAKGGFEKKQRGLRLFSEKFLTKPSLGIR